MLFLSIVKVQFKNMLGDPMIPLLVLVQPFIYSLLFGYLYKVTGNYTQLQHVFVGSAQMTIWQIMLYSGGLIVRSEFKYERTVPFTMLSSTSMYWIWSQRLFTCILFSLPSILISIFTGILFFNVIPQHLEISILGIFVFLFTLYSITLPLSLLFSLNANTTKLVQTITYPIFLLSGMMLSIDHFPKIVQVFSRLIPITWSTEALQHMMSLGVVDLYDLSVAFGSSFVFLIISWFLYKYTLRQIREIGEFSL